MTNERTSRPAYIADASVGSRIRYVTQTVKWDENDNPVVSETTHETTIIDLMRGSNGRSTMIIWVDSLGVTHRNASNYHIELI